MTARWYFSVDLEDPRDDLRDGLRYPARVPALTKAYLDLLRRHGSQGTFFVVGKVARRHPDLIRTIVAQGHEIGCHSNTHVALDRLDSRSFREDLLRSLDALYAAGAQRVTGYRAPCFSLTEQTRWAYDELRELGFAYSSSVLPAANPIYGWPAFGQRPRRVEGIVELPVTLFPVVNVPIGGVYFRALPSKFVEMALAAKARKNESVFAYHHPYDTDPDQPFHHPRFARWSPAGLLMRRGRREVLPRLERAAKQGFRFQRYDTGASDWARGRVGEWAGE